MGWAEAIFWLSALLLFHTYVGYPVWVAIRARLFPRPIQRGPYSGRYSVVMACYNEVGCIRGKLENLLIQTAGDRIELILVGDDGSTDGTASAARSIRDPRIVVHEFHRRRGKAAVLNDLIPHVRGEIVVMTDARQRLDPLAIDRLLACFHDPQVGVVSGELVFESAEGTPTAKGIGFYWNYEKWIRRNEARAGSVPGATGALYAIRRELLQPIPATTLLDDVAIPMQAVMRGWRCVFESEAKAFDRPSTDPGQESIRKRRTMAGVLQLVRLFPEWLNPFRNPIWFEFVSHKLLRLGSPWFLALTAITSFALSNHLLYRVISFGFIGVGILGVCGWLGWAGRLGAVPMMFLSMNINALLAAWDAALGRYEPAWRRAASDGFQNFTTRTK